MAEPGALTVPVLSPGSEFAGYRVEGIAGRGGMGIVYRAVDSALERTVALKVIAPEHTADPAAVARFKSEARLAASIDHPNLVTIYAAGEHEGVLFLAMRFMPGTDLRSVIAEHRPLAVSRINRIVAEVASALDAAHARGLVHRDVKPANILLTGTEEDEHVYLTDFGLTKRLGGTTAGLTGTGQWVGTPDYGAPEQIQGHDVDARTDIYSLGCVAYELLTGHRPYERDTSIATLWAHIADPPPAPCTLRSDLLPIFDSVITRATAKQPQQRFSSAGALSRALSEATALQLASTTHAADPQARPAPARTEDEQLAAAPAPPPVAPQPPTTEPGAITPGPGEPASTIPDSALAPGGADGTFGPERSRSRRRRLLTLAGLVAVVVVAAVLAIALSGGTKVHPPTAGHVVTPAVIRPDVARLNAIVRLFVAGKHLSHVEHKYTAAAANRRQVLDRLAAFHAPAQLRAAAQTLRQMTADSLSFNLYMARGQTALARAPDNAHNALVPRFLAEFNPYGQRYLGASYTKNDL